MLALSAEQRWHLRQRRLPPPFGGNGNGTGTVTTQYTAVSGSPSLEVTTVKDQLGTPKVTGTDGLGRLVAVTETQNSSKTYSTSYSYDVLDDLVGVNQSGQIRSFAYDSLKRLSAATNPENFSSTKAPSLSCAGGTYAICYSYDNDGNLLTKTDNRGVATSYTYDGLNRISSKSYNDGKTATVNYAYDNGGANSIGQLTSVSNGSSTTSYGQFDAMHRPITSTQATAVTIGSVTSTNTYSFGYTYYQSGAVASEAYPSGRIVNNCYDLAGRVTQVGLGVCSAGTAGAYASGIQYAAHGAESLVVMGNGVNHAPSYNSRLQMSGFSDLVGATTLLSATLNWYPSGGTVSQNNGNLWSSSYTATGGPGITGSLVFNQTYGYL